MEFIYKELSKNMDSVVAELQHQLEKNDNMATARLYNSITYEIKENIVELSFNKYGIYVDQGTKPHTPPFSAIEEWVKVKGLSINPWAVWQSIRINGTKAHPWLHVLDFTMFFRKSDLINAMKLDITEMLKLKFKNK